MTLIEIMVVVTIISLLMGAVAVVAWRQVAEARKKVTRTTVEETAQLVGRWAMDHEDACPDDLDVLFRDRVVTRPPRDAWGEPLLFRCPAERGVEMADVWSKGPDRRDGTGDEIRSWEVVGGR